MPRLNSLLWIFDALEREPGYLHKRMFGCDTAYLDGLLCLMVADGAAPWDGLMVCTARDHHASLMQQMPVLRPHPVLGKWLYIPELDPAFEDTVAQVTALVLARDPRVGVEPRPRRRAGKLGLPKG